jgi:hypothetical protein
MVVQSFMRWWGPNSCRYVQRIGDDWGFRRRKRHETIVYQCQEFILLVNELKSLTKGTHETVTQSRAIVVRRGVLRELKDSSLE